MIGTGEEQNPVRAVHDVVMLTTCTVQFHTTLACPHDDGRDGGDASRRRQLAQVVLVDIPRKQAAGCESDGGVPELGVGRMCGLCEAASAFQVLHTQLPVTPGPALRIQSILNGSPADAVTHRGWLYTFTPRSHSLASHRRNSYAIASLLL